MSPARCRCGERRIAVRPCAVTYGAARCPGFRMRAPPGNARLAPAAVSPSRPEFLMATLPPPERQHAFLDPSASPRGRFPNALRVGDTVYVSSEPIGGMTRSAGAPIEAQTDEAFADFVALLEKVGV